ncbi:MAG: hypothetical protein JWM34_362 [Ilumatobacteraceae bacterium]|nr:hypothetical protein [Ilumatobacteraceae bacterium]
MPPAPVTPDHLRERARLLRQLASRLRTSLAIDLHRRADHDTWIGPTPDHCHDDLVAMRASLIAAGQHLTDSAHALEVRAGQLAATGA